MKRFLFVVPSAIVFLIALFGAAVLAAESGPSGYRIVNVFSVPGDGFWDCVALDEGSGLIYQSHGTQLQVVDSASGRLTGSITNLKGVHGAAVVPSLGKGFISDGKDDSIVVFDLKTYQVLATIQSTGKNPDFIFYDGFSGMVFAFNGGSSNATVINANDNTVAGTVALEGTPEFAVSDGKGTVYVNIENKSSVSAINSKTLKVERTWSIAPGEEPSGLAIDAVNGVLFSVCRNKMMVVSDALTGKVITNLPTGERTDGAAFDPALMLAYSSNGEGTVTVVREIKRDSYRVVGNITTRPGARTIAINTRNHHLYLPAADTVPNPDKKQRRPLIKPGTFVILDIAPVK